ncbi:hypothetical protein IW262DRAFT_1293559 [Armillaria fumosa]|nr:hypothetical protein IW262DRAFT_1293559 [Armillaria fumosa]
MDAPSRIPFYELIRISVRIYHNTTFPGPSGPVFGTSSSGEIVSFTDPFNDVVVTPRANPFFVAAFSSRYTRYVMETPVYSAIGLKLLRLYLGAYALVPFKFYEGSRLGDFGRKLPGSYRDLPQPFKRGKEDLSKEEDDEKHRERNSVNVFKWMQDTKLSEIVLDTGNDKEISGYALETPREIVGKIPTNADAMWRELVEKGADSNLHILKRKRSPS